MGRRRTVLFLGVAAGAVLLASRAAAWLAPEPEPPTVPAPKKRRPAAQHRATPQRALPGPTLAAAHEPRFGATVQRLRRCHEGDALVTVERPADDVTFVVVRREGRVCFRLPFPDGARGPAVLRVHGTVDESGRAGPLVVAYTHPLDPEMGEHGPAARREEAHLVAVSLDGELLLERALEIRAPFAQSFGTAATLVPLLWEGDTLAAWSSARSWDGSDGQCTGSLLRLPARGPIAVAEGLPCEATGAIDADGDGVVELTAATSASDGTPWQAVLAATGDFVATWTGAAASRLARAPEPALLVGPATPFTGGRLLPWPWNAGGVDLPADDGVRFAFDADGDGAEEVVLAALGEAHVVDSAGRLRAAFPGVPLTGRADGASRELLVADPPCGIAAVDAAGGRRCAPGDLQLLARVVSAGRSFDWTADGTPDVTAIGTAADGSLWLAAWAEGDLTFSWQAGTIEELPPRHQAPRALHLTGGEAAEVLVATPDGFAVRAVPSGEVRWTGLAEDGVLDAWAFPATGASAAAVR